MLQTIGVLLETTAELFCQFDPSTSAMLPITTLRKLARDHFPDDCLDRILNPSPEKQKACLVDLHTRLTTLPRMEAWVREKNKKGSGIFYMGIYVLGPSSGRNPHDYFKLFFESREGVSGLWMHDAKRRRKTATSLDPIPIADIDHVVSFVEIVRQRQNRDHLRDEKKQKVAGLQQTGLTARLKVLGKQHNFAFAIGQTKRDVNLSIRLHGRKSGYHISFPKSRLDKVLDQVPEMIVMLENLQGLGVNFWTHNKKWKDRQSKWVEPK